MIKHIHPSKHMSMSFLKILFFLSILVIVMKMLIFKSSNNDILPIVKRTSLEQISILTLNPIPNEEISHMEALINGRLLVEDKCLTLLSNNFQNTYTLIWPSYFSIQIENERLVVLQNNEVVVYEGDYVQLSGGEINDISDIDIRKGSLCDGKPPYWLIGEEVKQVM